MFKKTSERLSKLAGRILRRGKATEEEVRSLAASVLSQDETPKRKFHPDTERAIEQGIAQATYQIRKNRDRKPKYEHKV